MTLKIPERLKTSAYAIYVSAAIIKNEPAK